jgi:RHH-type proline utilization regulon transcriptional repressor/proline dehydrogenase/delta 1-pyrroline-5-carboxylate dehydrogenase
MIRLVKGAYWDSEIKRAQLDGQDDYPVYTRKPHTDVAYLACARKLLAAPDAVFPQFATHNAHSCAAIQVLAGPDYHPEQYEFQCLHGMGEPLYEQVIATRPCRVYAPVGTHETLLAYLVRRLLENGANTSFVNRIADASVALDELVRDPVDTVRQLAAEEGRLGLPHPAIALPKALYGTASQGAGTATTHEGAPGAARHNSRGLDLADEHTLARLARAFADDAARSDAAVWRAEPLIAPGKASGPWQPVRNPADPSDVVGQVQEATEAEVRVAIAAASQAAPAWAATAPAERAARLEAAAQHLESETVALLPLLVREAGKTCANAVAEVREAVDFLRYYAAEVRRDFDNATHVPLGPVVCISPWNFPLAIFVGQIAAALAAGNVVLAKPAEQTPLVAAAAVRALHAAGVPAAALQLLPGRGETVGAALVGDARVNGVLFTGSTEVARLLQRTLAGRLTERGQVVPLIAETGGQNALVVDSSALAEQAVADIVSSAFDSAGQRCSALRLLCVQDDAADRLLVMLRGAIEELSVGDPRRLATDVGPVIDGDALRAIEAHVHALAARGRPVWRLPLDALASTQAGGDASRPGGTFVAPTLIELDDIGELQREVFGPVLHVLRYRRDELARTLERINATGYGLTQGVHTRIDETVAQVVGASRAGNIYVNRNIVGAVVGVQPFGGEGLSGTGPKAGGPLYLLRLLSKRPLQAARRAVAFSGRAQRPPVRGLGFAPGEAAAALEPARAMAEGLAALRAWALAQGRSLLAAACDQAWAESPAGTWHALPGPTGEANLYAVVPRESVLCLASAGASGGDGADSDRLAQLAAVLAVGSHAVWPAEARPLFERLPAEVREHISLAQDWTQPAVHIDAALQHGDAAALRATAARLAARPGPIVGLVGLAPGETRVPLERLVLEKSLSINTAAAGGNASLMTLG